MRYCFHLSIGAIGAFVAACAPPSPYASLSPVAVAALNAQVQCARGAVAREGFDIRPQGTADPYGFQARRSNETERTVDVLVVIARARNDTVRIHVVPSSGRLVNDQQSYEAAPASAFAREAALRVEAECPPERVKG